MLRYISTCVQGMLRPVRKSYNVIIQYIISSSRNTCAEKEENITPLLKKKKKTVIRN